MKSQVATRLLAVVGLIVFSIVDGGRANAADPDWKAVEQALGKSGQLQDGGIYRIGMPRTDLNVTVKGCLLYTSPSPRDRQKSRMPSSA